MESLSRFHPYEFLNDVYHRFLISFGYFQNHTRDANRLDGMYVRPSEEWAPIVEAMNRHNVSTKFLYKLMIVEDRMIARMRDFPKWYRDFTPQSWNSHF